MDRLIQWIEGTFAPLGDVAGSIAAFLPRLAGAVLLLVVGWMLATLLKRLTRRLLERTGRLFGALPGLALDNERYGRLGIVAATTIVFWAVLITFGWFAARILELDLVARGINAVVDYLPTVATAAVVLLVGIIIGGWAHAAVAFGARTADLAQSELLGRMTQIAVIAAAAVIAATELGLDVSFVANGAIVLAGVVVGAFALGLALGTPAHVSNVISARYVRRQFAEGDLIVLGDHKGRISEIGPTHVVLEAEGGDVFIPARLFADRPCIRIGEDGNVSS